ncbi:hypothetical protein ACG3RN_02900 [Pseudomonas aeruginosa]
MIGWGRACIGVGGLLLLGQLLGGALLLADDGEATLAVEHFWQFVFLIPAILVALGMFVLQHHVGSFAQVVPPASRWRLLPAGLLRHRPGPGQALRPAARLSPSRGPACPGLPEAFSFLI